MKKILLIDNSQPIREAIKDLLWLKWPDLTIWEAPNGARGIELAILNQPNLILLDGNMPVLTGYQMVLLLKQMSSVKNIPCIAVTGADPENPLIRVMIDHCQGYVPKPFDSKVLLNLVEKHLFGEAS